MIIDKTKFSEFDIEKLVKGTVVPRPIAWISSVGKSGIPNLAPYSYFNIISTKPLMFMIASGPGENVGKVGDKDTLSNIRETGDFVINMASAELSDKMHHCSTVFPKEVSEFDKAGLTVAKSERVTSPRVLEAPISMECILHKVLDIGNFNQIVGELVCYHIDDEVYMENDKVNFQTYDPIGRMAANYTHVRDLFYPAEVDSVK